MVDGGLHPKMAAEKVGAAAPTLQQEQLEFDDANAGDSLQFAAPTVASFDDAGMQGLELGKFLERPVLIDTFDWAEGTFLSHTIDPWTLFLSSTTTKKKLDNYGLLRMKLHLKFVISASPFYYGYCLVSYNPMPSFHPGPKVLIGSDEQMVTYSQRPHVVLLPDTSQGGHMELPFFYQFDWLRNKASEIAKMGSVRFDSPFVLRNANSVAGANVTIRTYAWATDVELSAPTVVLQSSSQSYGANFRTRGRGTMSRRLAAFSVGQDEYDGSVSGPASAVAQAAGALSRIPILAPMARATEIGAGAFAKVAAWFGYTNVPVVSDVMPFKDMPFGGMANTTIGTPAPKLTLDPKNELTLDSRTVGLDGTDELALESFVTRPSYLTTIQWDTTDAVETGLWGAAVSPSGMLRKNGSDIWPTPLSHASALYGQWGGSIIFSFHIICTKFHRGRLKFVWDPSRDFDPAVDSTDETAQITKIVDIGETRTVEFCVPWMQDSPFHETAALNTATASCFTTNPAGGVSTVGVPNGRFLVQVANELTSPVANAPVEVVVWVRGGDDFRFMNPSTLGNNFFWESQSDFKCYSMGEVSDQLPDLNQVYGGETALSLRQLMQRHSYIRSTSLAGPADNYYTSYFNMYPQPLNPSGSTKNLHDAGGGARRTYCANSPMSYLSPCFAGRRGSVYWVYVPNSSSGTIFVTRDFRSIPAPSDTDVYGQWSDSLPNRQGYEALSGTSAIGEASTGTAVYNYTTQTGVNFLVPYIRNIRFSNTHSSPFISPTTGREGNGRFVRLEEYYGDQVNTQGAGRYYCAAGPDFNLFFFAGIPTITLTTGILQPVV